MGRQLRGSLNRIPSEEGHLELFPLDFEEFLWAMGDEATVPLLKMSFEKKKPLGQALHRENHMKIDFLLSKGKKISPVEVKSDRYQRHASLDKFRAKFSAKLAEPYILYTRDVMIKDDTIHLPIYMTMFL